MTRISRMEKLADPQEKVLENIFFEDNSVIVSAGAGTGKTYVMVEALAESVLRLEKEGKDNPFEEILAVTFTVEAARQLKQKLRKRLEKHYEATNEKNKRKRMEKNIENESWISTIDSFTQKILKKQMVEVGLGNIEEGVDEYEIKNIKDDIIEDLKNTDNKELKNAIGFLKDWSPNEWYIDSGHWEDALWSILEDGKKVGYSGNELLKEAWRTFEEDMFLNKEPQQGKFKNEDKEQILDNICGSDKKDLMSDSLYDFYIKYKKLLEAIEVVLPIVDEKYDKKTKQKGKFTINDLRYQIVRYLKDKEETQCKNQFKYVFVDEFQDTSHIQCDLLSNFISSEKKVVLIGDSRQSIYEWRDADPNIFSRMIEKVENKGNNAKIEKLGDITGFTKVDLDVNFRSNKSIINFANNLFGDSDISVFKKKDYLSNVKLPYNDLKPYDKRPETNDSKIHFFDGIGNNSTDFNLDCADKMVNILLNIDKYEIYDEEKDEFRKAELGDCWILMGKRTKWEILREKLVENNVSFIFVKEKGLFQKSPFIQIIIDILNWINDPHRFESLARIVRSPLMGLEDKTLRYISNKEFNLKWLENDIPNFLNQRDIKELKELVNLREDLRWIREGRKSKLIETIIDFSLLDSIAMFEDEGKQELVNVRKFQDIVDSWEEDQLLSYHEFLDRINYYKNEGNTEEQYNFAPLAEQEEKDSVKISTIHSSKGLGFPIVFLYNPDKSILDSINYSLKNNLTIEVKKKNNDNSFVLLAPDKMDSFPNDILCDNRENKGWKEWEGIYDRIFDDDVCNIFDKYLIRDRWAESWRLFYVSLTRAKDHLFIPLKDELPARPSWEKEYHKIWNKNKSKLLRGCKFDKVDIDRINEKEEDIFKLPDLKIPSPKNFVPENITMSNVYDLLKCPRRYQYIVLNRVSGLPKYRDERNLKGRIFGNYLHEALEHNNFQNRDIKLNFINKSNIKNEIRTSLEKFYESDIFTKHNLDKSKRLKEKSFSFCSDINGFDVLFEGRIDLLLKNKNGISIFDYKSVKPMSKFEKEHHIWQIKGYGWLIKKIFPNCSISKLGLLYYDKPKKTWAEKKVRVDHDKFESLIKKRIPITCEEKGLKKLKGKHCEDCNIVKYLCKKE